MAGIYLHIPFCAKRCHYCNFFSTTSLQLRQQYIDALCSEAVMRANELKEKATTLYLGGGTPSQLNASQLEQLFNTLMPMVADHSEITIECNPDDINADYIQCLRNLPINRISLGVQSFNDTYLALLGRRHNALQAQRAIEMLYQAGFTNLSLDLMYGLPQQTINDWQQSLSAALALPITHLSAYHLSYEPGTLLYRQRHQALSEESSLQLFEWLCTYTQNAGFEHYEISNFAKPQCRSKHNSAYWQQLPYLGLGAGAHSYNGARLRRWNVSNLTHYLSGINNHQTYSSSEQLSNKDYFNDWIITALRTREGLNLQKAGTRLNQLLQAAKPYLNKQWLKITNNHLALTHQGIFMSDAIMRDLMW